MSNTISEIAIIGAGLGGAALALALSSSFPECRISIYEVRSASAVTTIHSGVILTPNGLAVLDKLEILPLIEDSCHKSSYYCVKDRDYNTIKKTPIDPRKQFAYSNHRVWRKLLLDTMVTVLEQRKNVSISYGQKLTKIHPFQPNADGVWFDIERKQSSSDRSTTTFYADLLIGADGLYSPVREYLHPDTQPDHTDITGIITHIPRASVALPSADNEYHVTIQDVPGALVIIPEDAKGEIIAVAKQFTSIPSSSITNRVEFERLQANKDALCDMFCRGYDEFGETCRKILDSVKEHRDEIFMWPFMKTPKLPSWYREEDGRVLIIGDAAHAIPPSSGQGVNQVLEDVWMLTLLLSGHPAENSRILELTTTELIARLHYWQESRQAQIDRVCEWTVNVRDAERLSQADRKAREKLQNEEGATGTTAGFNDMSWLYNPHTAEDIQAWFESRTQ